MKSISAALFSLTLLCTSASNAADTARPIKVALIAPLTGTSDYFGPVIANGVALAFREDPSVQLVSYDDQSKVELAIVWLERAISEGAICVIGPVETHTAAATIPIADSIGIPLVTPSATGDYLSQLSKGGWFFRAISSDAPRARDVADWIAKDHPSGAALLVYEESNRTSNSPLLYGTAIGDAVFAKLKELSYPVERIFYTRDKIDEQLRVSLRAKLQSQEIRSVGIYGRSVDTKTVAEMVREARSGIPLYLISPGKDMFRKSPLKNRIFADTDTILESIPRPEIEQFKVKYSAAFPASKDPIDQYATFGYDAGIIVVEALKRMKESGLFDRETQIELLRDECRRQIEKTPNERVGLMSEGGFTSKRELAFRPHRLELRDGEWIQLGATPAPSPLPLPWWRQIWPWILTASLIAAIAIVMKKRHPETDWIIRTSDKPNKGVIVFVHGLGGDAHSTWQKFPELLHEDSEVAKAFDVGFYGFPTGIVIAPWAKPVAITTLADGLAASLRLRFSSYKKVILVSHSLGGVVVRKLLQRLIMSGSEGDRLQLQRIVGVGLYGVPNEGSSLANIGSFLNFWHRHLKQLCRDSDYLTEMNQWWESAGAQEQIAKIPLLVAIGASDMVVPQRSAKLRGPSVQEFVIVDPDPNIAGHLGIVKPKNRTSMSYLALKNLVAQSAATPPETP